MKPTIRVRKTLATYAGLALITAGCGESTVPTESSAPAQVATSNPTAATTTTTTPGLTPMAGLSFPALTKPGRIYLETGSVYGWDNEYHGGALVSRFVLYDDGTFGLQFVSTRSGFFEYKGTYSTSGSNLTTVWDGWNVNGPWQATATLQNNLLTIKYGWIMAYSDFCDAVYVLATP